jgi:hypothetical protein
MISIREATENILTNDYVALESLKRRVMNFSEYARSIRDKVAEYTKKEVGVQSIVVTLARLEQKLAKGVYRPADVSVAQLTVQSPITQLVYPKTQENLQALTEAVKGAGGSPDAFFSFSSSTKDVALVVSEKIEIEMTGYFSETPILAKKGLSALTIRFDEKLVREPNVGLALLQKLAARKVVLDAALTTYNEFTLVFENRYLHDAVEALQPKS